MIKNLRFSLILAFCFIGFTHAGNDKPHWTYFGHEGPEHWGELDPAYSVCAMGRNQSPINLINLIEADLPALGFHYTSQTNEILNNGHTVQANFAPGSLLSVDGREFELKQVHFHAPSENQVNGRSYAMEAHFVHADVEGNLAVIAVMFEQGVENGALDKLWAEMPEKAGEKHQHSNKVGGEMLMPESRDYYRFNGSLTTPPCREGVRWLLLKNSLTASKEQIAHFSRVMQHPNNRPIQQINSRVVLQ